MTATSLHKSLPFRNALRVVKQNQKMTIVTCILQLLGIPLGAAALMWELVTESHDGKEDFIDLMDTGHGYEMYIVIAALFLGVAVFMGMFAAINSFIETHKKTKVDMLYALPLTGTQRFFSDYAGGCIMYIVPYMIAVLLGWGVIFGLSPFVLWENDQEFASFGEFMGEIVKIYALATLGLFFLMLLYYSLSVLVTVCCGTLFESIYTNILLNGLIPGTVALIIALVTNDLSFEFEYTWQIIGFMSPIGGLIYLMLLISGEITDTISPSSYQFAAVQTTSHDMIPSYLRWIFAIFLLTAVLTAGAWLLYKRRKAEDVGKPFIYTAAYYVMLTLATVAVLCAMRTGVFGPVLIASAIGYFIMEVIRKRGFKRFWLSVITYVATVGLSIGGYFLLTATGCFGRVNYVPASVGVSSVRVEFHADDNIYRTYDYVLEYTDRDVISEVTKFHRDLIGFQKSVKKMHSPGLSNRRNEYSSNYYALQDPLSEEMLKERYAKLVYTTQEYDSNYYNEFPSYTLRLPVANVDDESGEKSVGDWLDPKNPLPDEAKGHYIDTHQVRLTYYTLTGSTVHRVYDLNADYWRRFLDIVQGTGLYAEATSKGMSSRMTDQYTEYVSYLKKNMIPGNLRLQMTATPRDAQDTATHSAYIKDAPQKFEQLWQAYRFDLEAMTAEDFRTSEIKGYLSGLPMYSKCAKSWELLKEWGIEPFNTAEWIGYADATYDSAFHNQWMGMRIYAPDQYRTASVDYPHSTLTTNFFKYGDPAYEDTIYFSYDDSLEKTYPELYALLSAARKNYVTAENCYVINFNGTDYIIPEKDSDLAEAVIAKGSFCMLDSVMKNDPFVTGGASVDDSQFFSDADGAFSEQYFG
ncbi:MAG: ABC transporter permease [Oscillospiraceae bacterium]|nr:ABC transporter permease [Oscillospiraceae bacterium]